MLSDDDLTAILTESANRQENNPQWCKGCDPDNCSGCGLIGLPWGYNEAEAAPDRAAEPCPYCGQAGCENAYTCQRPRCDGINCSPGGTSHGGCGCGEAP